jgi:two-component system, chemotaxis family, chemotaxis protein CheY
LTLPGVACKVRTLAAYPPSAHDSLRNERMNNGYKARILVIDDDPFFRSLLRVHLSQAGYAVQVAEDAVEGGKALLHPEFDLVLCDIDMPYLTGLELVSLLRATEETASIPVVFASSHMDTKTLMEAEELGAAGYLIKPFQSEQLLETVERCLIQSKR